MTDPAHWDEVYRTKSHREVSWYQPTPDASLAALDRLDLPETASLIDIGGGASSLVDCLLERGWRDLSVLDIAAPALDVARQRIGAAADRVEWLTADMTRWTPTRSYDVWHDRAVFHFLTEEDQRDAYRRALAAGTKSGAYLIIATFAPDGPERCSGLPVRRYDSQGLAREFGPDHMQPAFTLVDSWRQVHETPAGNSQAFTWCLLRRA